ncbi:MAG: cytochrome d ubiquinol oxidase subunit II [Flavobacteriales bacterium]
MDYLTLQQYWWFLVSLLGALFVFLNFVQGGQSLLFSIGKTPKEKELLLHTIGVHWELTFTTLVTFGGAFFASFPLFYATSFGGAYWVWFAILVLFILQAVSYKFHKKSGNFLGEKTYEVFLWLNGTLAPLLVGIAVGTFFNGAMFTLDHYNSVTWQTSFRGLEAVLDWHNVSLGLALVFLARILGAMFYINRINEEEIRTRARKQVLYNAIPFLICFLAFSVALLFKSGVSYTIENGETIFTTEENKYLSNFLEMPTVLVMFLLGVVGVLLALGRTIFAKRTKCIWIASLSTVLVVLSVFLLAGYNNTSFYPSLSDIQSSLCIQNASSSKFTLKTMSYVSLGIPFVAAYIWYAWKSLTKKEENLSKLPDEAQY